MVVGILSEINLDSSTTGKYNVNLCNKGSRNFQVGPVMLIFSDWLNVFSPLLHAAAGYSIYFFSFAIQLQEWLFFKRVNKAEKR